MYYGIEYNYTFGRFTSLRKRRFINKKHLNSQVALPSYI